MKLLVIISLISTVFSTYAQSDNRYWWNLMDDGSIVWKVKPGQVHTDHIEMSGKYISVVVTYGVNSDNKLVLKKRLIFPMLRTIPNDTRGSLWKEFDENIIPIIKADGVPLEEFPELFQHNGIMTVISRTNKDISIERTIYPSVDKAAYMENYKITNTGSRSVSVDVTSQDENFKTDESKGAYGVYNIRYKTFNATSKILSPGESDEFSVVFNARKLKDPEVYLSSRYELVKRRQFIEDLNGSLVLKTPDKTINALFSFAKLRTTESIYETKGGLMHGPGGSNYYAALWANDEGEFTSPLFPFIGNATGNASAINCYRMFAKYINPEFNRLPSSIVAEGDSTWNWTGTKYGDRGDAAMLLYGATRFALTYADTLEAKRLWPFIEWCVEYNKGRKTAEGVIASDTDGEEGRFTTGKANLYVNSLAYSGFHMAARLASVLNLPLQSNELNKEAALLRVNIEKYFHADIMGFKTYKYHKDATTLYTWAGMPLAMGIFDHAEQTQNALFSKYIWKNGVMLSESGNTTRYFERPMLNSFRGLFYSGHRIDTTLKYFSTYSKLRLLGNHVPYVVEAYPEGDGRQLSGDNALYCRIITEGLFGITPLTFNSFTIAPRLPRSWEEMSLNHIKAFKGDITIHAERSTNGLVVQVFNKGKLIKDILWDGIRPIEVIL